MNRGIYKIIFNRSRGCVMAVAETAIAQGKSPGSHRGAPGVSPARRRLRPLAFSLMLLCGQAWILPTAGAQIIADPAAPKRQQPTVLPAANGIPQINIQTPSEAGVSVNQYRRFDINEPGAILNNSRRNTSTRLGGWIQGNPWLARGEAKIIVNQVNSADPTRLGGHIEVAGRRAEVVVANPAGIQVNGGGFINAAGVTLSTGTPVLNNGRLEGFRVEQGQIGVSGRGLDSSDADYTRILSQAAQIHAGIWGKDLLVSAGNQQVAADGTSEAVSGSPGAAPAVAIDTGVLGGMYAGKITLISHDAGAGIQHAGQSFAGAGGVHLSADGTIRNSGSLVAADKNSQESRQATASVRAAALDNSGTLAAQGEAAIRTQSLSNSGLLSSGDSLRLENGGRLDNSGTVEGGRLDVVSGSLDNRGRIRQSGLQKLAVESRELHNHASGVMGYAPAAAGSGSQNGGTAGGSGQPPAGSGHTSPPPSGAAGGGQIAVSPSLPTVLADGSVRVRERLDNHSEITANGGMDLKIHAQLNNNKTLNLINLQTEGNLLDNRNGLISVSDNAHIASDNILNMDGSIDAEALSLQGSTLDNRKGTIRVNQRAVLQLSEQINNRDGRLSSATELKIHDGGKNTLLVNNSQGEILAGSDVNVQAASLAMDGLVAGDRDVIVTLHTDVTTAQDIMAGRILSLSTAGLLKNNHSLHGGEGVHLQAAEIHNRPNGKIESGRDTRVRAQQSVINRGLINSNGLTRVDSDNMLENIGSGRIYGDQVSLSAGYLRNKQETVAGETKAAVIAARERLDIGAEHIINQEHSLLSSEGGLSIGARLNEHHQAAGMAASLVNSSARIEVQGDAHIAARDMRNVNAHLQLEEYLAESKHTVDYTFESDPQHYAEGVDGQAIISKEEFKFYLNDGTLARYYHKGSVNRVKRYEYHTTTYRQRIVNSEPGRILIGGNLQIQGSDWQNQDSQILVGGTLSAADGKSANTVLRNMATRGQGREIRRGYIGQGNYKKSRFRKRIGFEYAGSYDSDQAFSHDFAMPVSIVKQGIGNLSGAQNKLPLVESASGVSVDIARLPSLGQTTFPNSLYTVRPDHPGYLVETDPAFADYRQWLGSDYMLKALGQDGHSLHKRLGDGYYEQRLVNEQIARLTGYRRLDGYQNDEDQFKALMNQGITFAREQRLVPGIGLSPEQVARLTSDIVWLEPQTLTLADGSSHTVLVPKVYVLPRQGDLGSAGSLVSADEIRWDMHNGQLLNSGTLSTRKLMHLQADNIDNRGVLSGGSLVLQAKDRIRFEGGVARANSSFHAEARTIDLRSSTETSGDHYNGQTRIDRVAGVYLTGTEQGLLSLQAKQDIRLHGAVLDDRTQNGRIQVNSENGDIHLGTVKTEHHDSYGQLHDRSHRHTHQTRETGTHIQTVGDILLSGKNITASQAHIDSADGHVTLQAKEMLQLSEGRRTLALDDAAYTRSRGLLSANRQQEHREVRQDEAVSGSLSARRITLSAGADLHIRGTDVVSDENTRLEAGRHIGIEAARSRRQETMQSTSAKSGLFAGFKRGTLQIGYGRQQNRLQQAEDQESLTAQQIGSLHGHTVLQAGGNVRTEAAQLAAGKDLMIEGQNIELGAAYLSESLQQQQHSRGSRIGLSLNLKPAEVRQLDKQIDRVRHTAAQSGALNKWRAWDSGGIQAAAEPFMPPGGMSATRTNSRSNERHRQIRAVGSSANAGGQITLRAKAGDADIIGSQVFGQQGLNISAGGNINIVAAAEERQHSGEQHSKTSGLTQGDSTFSRFIGSRTDLSREEGSRIQHSGSAVGSGSGAVRLTAGRHYTQTGSQVLSDGDIDIRAQNITVQAADNPYRHSHYYSHTQKGLTVGLSTPLTDAVQAAQKTAEAVDRVGRSNHNRTNAMAAANAGWQGYQAAQSIRGQTAGMTGGQNPGAGLKVSITYGEQRNSQERHSSGHSAHGAQILGQGQVSLTAAGAGQASHIRIRGAEVAGQSSTRLEAEGDIQLQAAGQSHREDSRSRQAGWNAGVALDFSNGASLGFTGGGNYGKGQSEGEAVRHLHSRIGSAGSRTTLKSGGDTTLQGTRVLGQGITLDARHLHIESPQESARHSSSQYHGQADITVGYGFSASGQYSQSQLNAEHRSVAEQSGLYAGDDGFQVNVSGHTRLDGGLIVSGQAAEEAGRNHFISGSLSSSDLANHSRYSGRSLGLGAGLDLSGDSLGQGSSNQSGLSTVAEHNRASSSLGYGRERDSQSSHTRSGIGTRNIRLTDEAAQQTHSGQSPEQAAAAVYTDRRSDTADAQAGYLNNRFDAERVQNEIDLQTSVSQTFAPIAAQGVAAASDYLGSTQNHQHAQMLKNLLEAELKQNHNEAEKAGLREDLNRINQYLADNQAAYELWKEGGIGRAILHAGAGGLLTGSADGALGAGAAALSAPHLETLGNHLGGTGKAVVDTLGGAAIGWMAGGTGGAVTGSNADWHNRQLHPDEIKLTTSREFVDAMKAQVRRVEGQDISDQEASIRLQKQILRWVDKSSQDGHTDQVAISVLPMSGRFKSNGLEYSWDYRRYDQHNPAAFNNPGLFAGHTTPAHRDHLSRSHAGRSNADIRRQAEANEALALNLVDTATSLIRTPAGKVGIRESVSRFFRDLGKPTGGTADLLLAGAGGGNIRASEGRIPEQAMASTGGGSATNRGSAIPTPEPTPVTLKGLENQEIQVVYKSNSKHTPGANGWRPNAGREPRNSLDLFKESVPIPSNNAVRYAQDENGHVHRFSISNNNEWHWSGGTGDIRNPLQLDNKVKADLRRSGWKGRVLR